MLGVDDLHLEAELARVPARPAEVDQLARVHDPAYLDRLRGFSSEGGGALDADTYVTAASWDAARLAAGAGLVAVDELSARGSGVAFVAARPPGHHAVAGRGMGFCLVNNVAVAAAALVAGGERVLIVDWDVHHGNGTQDIFWDEPRVLYVSTHQWPCYPGTGRVSEVGGAGARGTTLNVPLPPGPPGTSCAPPSIGWWRPPSSGSDPPGCWCRPGSTPTGPTRSPSWTSRRATSPNWPAWWPSTPRRPGRLVLFLEGGYDLAALRSSTAATLGALVGARADNEPPTAGGPGAGALAGFESERRRSLEQP